MHVRLIPALMLFASTMLYAQTEAPSAPVPQTMEQADAQRQKAETMRKDAEKRHQAEQAACYQKILVNACLDDAKKRYTNTMIEARKLDAPARDFQRETRRTEVEGEKAQRDAERPVREAEQKEKAEQYRTTEAEKAAAREQKQLEKEQKAAENRQKLADERAKRKVKEEKRAKKQAEQIEKKARERAKAEEKAAAKAKAEPKP